MIGLNFSCRIRICVFVRVRKREKEKERERGNGRSVEQKKRLNGCLRYTSLKLTQARSANELLTYDREEKRER
jgi:hypothetical protein